MMRDPSTSASPGARREAIPNLLTMARLVMTALVIVALALYDHPDGARWTLPTALVIFIIAALTDALDGWLARRWNAVSAFGRVMDPFADKVLVLGSFVMLAGPGFADSAGAPVSGVATWMAVVILARELLVTSIRGVMEGSGVSFGASWAGKAKMIVQSGAVPLILALLWLAPRDQAGDPQAWARAAMLAAAWITVIVTILSGAPYIAAAVRAARPNTGERPT